jgi:hypothetical protein
LALSATPAGAQSVGFLTEQQRLASYCAGVSEARLRETELFLKEQCVSSTRRDCREAGETLEQIKRRDRRLWDYLTRNIFTSSSPGRRERSLARNQIAKGNDDWLACQRRNPGQRPEELPICRDSHGCLIDARFGFLDQ